MTCAIRLGHPFLRRRGGGFDKMRWILIGVALCGAVPALASKFPPEIGSFSYLTSHSPLAAPFDYADDVLLIRKIQQQP